MVFQQDMSSGQIKVMFRGMQSKCLEAMSLLIGPGMSPPRCGEGVVGTVKNVCVTNGKWWKSWA